ncbi:MAG TPA: enoyl-CoA hydratase/isomerase family protein [Gemmatimonadales bacterium]|nr:enoyl-CoA hydratase/isomerase family protein [Gemmatimonadales bacterium]
MAAFEKVTMEIEAGVATLTLSRPDKLNALDAELCRDLLETLAQAARSDAVRAVIITGRGRAFCAGADLSVLGAEGAALVAAGKEVALAIRRAPKPVLAAVNGAAAGGGANLALACDYRIASDAASIGQVFAKLGLTPDWGGAYFLPRLVGMSRALELVWSARMVPAAEAHAIGLFDRVVPADRLLLEARALALAWAAFPPLAIARAKELLYAGEDQRLAALLDLEITTQNELFATPEARERIGQSLAKTQRSR